MTNVDNALRILEENNVSGFYQLFVLIQTCMHTYQAFTNMNKLYFFSIDQVRPVNISNDDIVDGNPKLTLGLMWYIISHFQVWRWKFFSTLVHYIIDMWQLCSVGGAGKCTKQEDTRNVL